jgi:sugar (pentulose or hexulose) kinase
MPTSHIAVLDVGKSLTKLSVWDESGVMLARESRANAHVDAGSYAGLDVAGISRWLDTVLADFAARGHLSAFIPVAHGAAAAVLRNGQLACAPIDYESTPPENVCAKYLPVRDAFAHTGSPALPACLNLGMQLEWLEQLDAKLFSPDTMIVTWPQYWAWALSGVAATEVSSLGCHSDLWSPPEGAPSRLAQSRGWAARLAPLRRADETLGKPLPEWTARAAATEATDIYCGLHDSNAALVAARGFSEMAAGEATVLSTGTWFIALRATDVSVDLAALPESRDCLVNIDPWGHPVPSARFMGGREAELLCGADSPRLDAPENQAALLIAARSAVARSARILPSFAPGGPFPNQRGRWVDAPSESMARGAVVALYLALMANASLDLIGARERIIVEGRFAAAQVVVRALASLRPRDRIFVCPGLGELDVAFGALRLVLPSVRPRSRVAQVAPLEFDLADYAAQWRRDAAAGGNSP